MQHFDLYQITKFLTIPYNALLATTFLVSGIILCIPNNRKYAIKAQDITQKTNNQTVHLVDIRENIQQKIPKSKYFNINELSKIQNLNKHFKNKQDYIILIAENYKLALPVVKMLKQNMYKQVFILEHGIEGWKNAGFPLQEKLLNKYI